MADPDRELLTSAQRDALEAELAELEGPKRAAIVDAIKTARSFGDIAENFEYHSAKNEQGLLVEIADEDGETMEVEISAVGGVGPESPLGKALMGAGVGDVVEVHAPRGTWKARVL